ncbi:MAG: rRNA maturation RNase YbeY [Clostridia bacterium]|nr:rRNA maturation RNase YbeY [Clostridia bacterium]
MEIIIENLQEKHEIADRTYEIIKNAVAMSLDAEGFRIPSEVSIMLVDDNRIREINAEQRNIDKSTDVLSFPMVNMTEGRIISHEGDFDLDENLLLLGDIVISIDTTIRQAEEYGHSFERELAFLVTHGIFHLLGYDHEDNGQEQRMISKQESVLGIMNLKR